MLPHQKHKHCSTSIGSAILGWPRNWIPSAVSEPFSRPWHGGGTIHRFRQYNPVSSPEDAIQLAGRLVRYGPLFIIAACREEAHMHTSRKDKKNDITHIQISLKQKKSVNLRANIQIKFQLHHCISYVKIFKTRPHLTILREFSFLVFFW